MRWSHVTTLRDGIETEIRVAVNEAVELAKRYSGEDGHRFINGVLRRITDAMKNETP